MKRLFIFSLVVFLGISFTNVLVHSQESSNQTTLKNNNIQPEFKRMTARLSGEIIWKGHDLSHINVSVYRDEKLKDLYTSGVSRLGTFTLRVEPGRYYLVAYVDIDSSGKFDEGDGYGVLGINDWNDESQKHLAIEIGENSNLKGIKIPITARLQNSGEELKLVPESTYQPSEYEKFIAELSRATSGCRGILKFTKDPEHADVTMLIIAYTDTSWKYRSGMTVVDPTTGKWELRLKPGKYYLMAIVDKNSSNTLDNGDPFGFYGVKDISKKGAFPQPVLIKQNTFTENLEIHISTTYTAKEQSETIENAAIIIGRVTPFSQDETGIRVEVYDDSTLVNPIATTLTAQDGTFRLQLPTGEYYIIANHDMDGNGRYSAGDRLGGLGSDSIVTTPPTSIIIGEGETRSVNIILTAQYDAEGQLVAIHDSNIDTSLGGTGIDDSSNTDVGETGVITGRISTFFATSTGTSNNNSEPAQNNNDIPDGILSLSTTPSFDSPIVVPLFLEKDGSYTVQVEPGTYYILAVVDQNKDGRSGTSDGIGVFGTHQPVRGTPAAITVLPGKITPHVDIDILASYVDEDGTMSEITDGGRWNIARMHGPPEDIFKYSRNGKFIEEWMYWTMGIGFVFETDGSGWKLKDKNEFEPNTQNLAKVNEKPGTDETANKEAQNSSEIKNELLTGFSLAAESVSIYYSHDGVLWRLAPATAEDIELNQLRSVPIDTRIAPLDSGFHPSVSEKGTLVYHDFDDNVIFRDIGSGKSMVYLENRELAKDVSISPDGEYLVYTKSEQDRRKRIIIHHLETNRTFPIPSTAMEMSNPAWRRDGELLAYATAGSIENPDMNHHRNIYIYDLVANSVEPIVISPEDDSEPSWHPSEPNTLAFSKGTENKLRQIWMVNVSTTGKRTEKQITLMGGSRPVWIPPNGRWILYENNGQLWTVDTHTPNSEAPLLSNGRVVFGYQPIAVPVGEVSK